MHPPSDGGATQRQQAKASNEPSASQADRAAQTGQSNALQPGLNPQQRPAREVGQAVQPGGKAQDAQAKLLADLAALQQASRRGPEAGAGEGAAGEWRPPSGQTGDGRTSLNERLGY